MSANAITVSYLAAAVLFIVAIKGFAKPETAKGGNRLGILGMAIAVAVTMALAFREGTAGLPIVAGTVALGTVVGAFLARSLPMTAMPELVALLNSFGGLAAVFVGMSSYLEPGELDETERAIHLVECWIGVAIGAITFTGSVVAWGKLRGTFSGAPRLLPGRHLLNLAMLGAIVGMCWPYLDAVDADAGLQWLLILAGVAAVLGVTLVVAIGGADMPVVVSLLNSYSGWAAASTGFVLRNDLLIVTGAIVGASGAILTIIMCRAMNRSILNVVFGGFGTAGSAPAASGDGPQGEVQETDVDGLVAELKQAKEVVIVPGYGMAVARAQHGVKELVELLQERDVRVRFAIHPVAGRLPGHMNVLLAEAGVPYDIVLEMDLINEDFPETDVALVIGANDIVNPSAATDASSPIYGMPVLEVWEAKRTVVFKRSMSTGYAGVQNPLFFHERTRMLFGDAKKSVDAIVGQLRD
ncbi:MAG TPA: NAD(P)(+) transhydrogenase (Re/Si-specific) subunit beta [Polyangiaceae bacterium LLY-WYZ-15_(1-7)]|nr:NAD(P) transhydrogenase subunit beta [Myxococcales bacterium]MAT24061.1 NAD(P) transhydrogenase subunit beta [Sandaracinus sp.]HJK94328.1 NAD(P)(+) transhydrogenase (Re/Si-specific) subunit beta [Polyangiaceae bacterium LLY-WYZ-15_(1-7)]MBJ70919.1 NAD(P) transhydrogenase subunit beta [Sandaracinus sp.]HJL03915.1 NAD(P)(+) transhydrogenase (Re/Si-specific) subunit beta [Polyangiaceae bacterium LLY-WYZ-15_(1-7)]